MKRTGVVIDDARRAALKALVPHAHLLAGSYSLPNREQPTTEHHQAVADELRRLGDLMDGLAERGTATVLAAFFGGLG